MSTSEGQVGTIRVPGGELAYQDRGSGAPVVLLHAAIGDRRGWQLLAPGLARNRRVISYDARGFGGSSRPGRPFALADDLARLLDALDLPSAALVGNSMGAATAVDFALAHPDRVESLVLVAPGLSGFDREDSPVEDRIGEAVDAGDLALAAELDRRYWAPLDSGPEVELLIDRMVQENAHVYALSDDLLIEPPDATDQLHRLRPDVLVVLGGEDTEDVRRIGALLGDRVPRVSVATIPGADHLVPLRAPEALLGLIEEHLEHSRSIG
jgi:3-oxoadipate enol-lactonase